MLVATAHSKKNLQGGMWNVIHALLHTYMRLQRRLHKAETAQQDMKPFLEKKNSKDVKLLFFLFINT